MSRIHSRHGQGRWPHWVESGLTPGVRHERKWIPSGRGGTRQAAFTWRLFFFPLVRSGVDMISKVTSVFAIGFCLALAACNTVRGAAADINSAANCTENTMKNGYCK